MPSESSNGDTHLRSLSPNWLQRLPERWPSNLLQASATVRSERAHPGIGLKPVFLTRPSTGTYVHLSGAQTGASVEFHENSFPAQWSPTPHPLRTWWKTIEKGRKFSFAMAQANKLPGSGGVCVFIWQEVIPSCSQIFSL